MVEGPVGLSVADRLSMEKASSAGAGGKAEEITGNPMIDAILGQFEKWGKLFMIPMGIGKVNMFGNTDLSAGGIKVTNNIMHKAIMPETQGGMASNVLFGEVF